jgi:transcriptional regulator with XRE-family HTH domain
MQIPRYRLLRLLRESLNLKQSDVADDLGISAAYLSLLESGKKDLNADMLERLCEKYNVPSYLFAWNEKDFDRTATKAELKILNQMHDYLNELLLLILKRNASTETQSAY